MVKVNVGESTSPCLSRKNENKMVSSENKTFEKEENKNNAVQDFKHLNENYDSHLDNILPEDFHRGDVATVNRFLGYHDAMMATCGTFLVLPLRNLKKMVTDEDLKHGHLPHGDYIHANTLPEYLSHMSTEFVMFFLGFFIICTIWEANNVRTLVLKRTDDFLTMLGLLQMFAIIVLPFSMALQGNFPHEDVGSITTMIVLIIISIFEIVMILYGMATPKLLHLAIVHWSPKVRRRFMLTMLIKPFLDILIVGIAGAFSLLDYRVSWVLFGLLILWPFTRRLVFFIRRRLAGEAKQEKCQFFWFFTKGQISKERIEAFTDAAVAIIACVLILDITVEEFPSASTVKKDGLVSVLHHMEFEFLTFFGTYLGVTVLWYVNHTVLHLFHTVDMMTLSLQKIFLAFLCITPLNNNMLTKFGPMENHDLQVAVLWAGCTFFIASLTQLLMLIWGYHRSKENPKLLHKWANCKANRETNKNQLLYVGTKCLVLPFWSFVSIFGYFGDGKTPGYMISLAIGGSFITFIILKLIFLNHVGKEGITKFTREMSAYELEMRKEMEKELNEGNTLEEDQQATNSSSTGLQQVNVEEKI